MMQACPCADAHRRLMDLHEDIHRAIEHYLDQEEFRRYLNSAIQASRSITWLLQKRKSRWSNFDDWYDSWVTESESNPVLSWGVRSRNRIVKEEDLETHSYAIITYYDERLELVQSRHDVPPGATTEDMMNAFLIASKQRPSIETGYLRVQRQWVDAELPQYELVRALRALYESVARIVRTAHRQKSIELCATPAFKRPCVDASMHPDLPCIEQIEPLQSLLLDVATGIVLTPHRFRIDTEEFTREEVVARYGEGEKFSGSLRNMVAIKMRHAKNFLNVDGYAGTVMHFLKGEESAIAPLSFGQNEPRELKIDLALSDLGAWQFETVIFASEMWITVLGSGGLFPEIPMERRLAANDEFYNADEQGGREEALIVVGLSKSGSHHVATLPFARTVDGIVYGQTQADKTANAVPRFMRPVYRTWMQQFPTD